MSKKYVSRAAYLFLIAAACGESPTPPEEALLPPPRAVLQSVPSESRQLSRPHEVFLLEVAEAIPAFGGFTRATDGTIQVLLTDVSAFQAALDALSPRLASRLGKTTEQFRVAATARKADYSFRDLARWRDLVTTNLWMKDVGGIVSVDLVEDENLISLGVVDGSDRSLVASLLDELGIPSGAVRVVDDSPTLPDRAPIPPGATWLTIRWDTIMSGIIHTFKDWSSDETYACTLGITISDQFLTASHCTNIPFTLDLDTIWQSGPSSSNVIGLEVNDPVIPPGICIPLCRWSDASLSDYVGYRDFLPGVIAKPVGSHPTSGTTLVDQSVLGIFIEGELPNPIVGDTVQKVGEKTGWTYGLVTSTCQDRTMTVSGVTRKLLCQDGATYGRDEGDSGAPVFIELSYGVFVVGMHSGSGSGLAWFSAVANIEEDLSVDLFIGPYPH